MSKSSYCVVSESSEWAWLVFYSFACLIYRISCVFEPILFLFSFLVSGREFEHFYHQNMVIKYVYHSFVCCSILTVFFTVDRWKYHLMYVKLQSSFHRVCSVLCRKPERCNSLNRITSARGHFLIIHTRGKLNFIDFPVGLVPFDTVAYVPCVYSANHFASTPEST